MSGRRRDKINLHKKLYFKASSRWTCIQNKLVYLVSSILSYLFVFQMLTGQHLSGALPTEYLPRLFHERIAAIAAPRNPHLHFVTFKISSLCSKMEISKTAWINAWQRNHSFILGRLEWSNHSFKYWKEADVLIDMQLLLYCKWML